MSKQPLLPHHVNHTHRLISPAISFPSSQHAKHATSSDLAAVDPTSPTAGENGDHRRHVLAGGHDLQRPGLPKVSRECLISEIKCYGRNIVPVLLINFVLLTIFLCVYFSRR